MKFIHHISIKTKHDTKHNYILKKQQKTRVWANAQRDGRPAEYVAPSVQCRKVWLTPTTRVLCSNPANIGECKTWMQSELRTWQNSVTGQQPPNMYR